VAEDGRKREGPCVFRPSRLETSCSTGRRPRCHLSPFHPFLRAYRLHLAHVFEAACYCANNISCFLTSSALRALRKSEREREEGYHVHVVVHIRQPLEALSARYAQGWERREAYLAAFVTRSPDQSLCSIVVYVCAEEIWRGLLRDEIPAKERGEGGGGEAK